MLSAFHAQTPECMHYGHAHSVHPWHAPSMPSGCEACMHVCVRMLALQTLRGEDGGCRGASDATSATETAYCFHAHVQFPPRISYRAFTQNTQLFHTSKQPHTSPDPCCNQPTPPTNMQLILNRHPCMFVGATELLEVETTLSTSMHFRVHVVSCMLASFLCC